MLRSSKILLSPVLIAARMRPIHIGGGASHADYKQLEDTFRYNFTSGWEEEGAAFAAFVNGECVFDMWGGFADRTCERLWREDTLTTIFSATKSVSAICLVMQYEQGHIKYTDTVGQHWPEFAVNGKENITIQEALSHRAGIPYLQNLDHRLSIEDVNDLDKMQKLIEEQRPQWEPGTKTGYHALTFGWLADGIMRHVDPQKRSIGQFFKNAVADKHNVDLYIGETREVEHRMARTCIMSPRTCIRETLRDWRVAKNGYIKFLPCCDFYKAIGNLQKGDFTLFNNPETRLAGQPAVNGISTARALAHAHVLLGEGHLVSQKTLQMLSTPVYPDEFDTTVKEVLSKGYGFLYTRSPFGTWQLGHMGVGGQNVKLDVENRIAFAYLTNGMKAGQGERTRTMKRLERSLYQCVKGIRESANNNKQSTIQ